MTISILSTLIKGLSEASKSELADTTDLIIEGDVTKRTRLATLADWIRGKLGIGTASSLTTTSKEVVGAINELNTNTGDRAALGPKMKSGTASYRIIGKMCFVTVEATPSSALAQGDVIISGLPAPLEEFYFTLGAAHGNYSAYMRKTGTVIAYYPGYTTPERIDDCFCYPVNPM